MEKEGKEEQQLDKKKEVVYLSSVGARNEETMIPRCAIQTLDREKCCKGIVLH